MTFGLTWATKQNMDFQYSQRDCFLEKYTGLYESVAFVQNLGILQTRMTGKGTGAGSTI